MSNFVRVLIDSDPERELQFKVVFELGNFNWITIEFKKNKQDCINLPLREIENLGYIEAKALLRSTLSQCGEI